MAPTFSPIRIKEGVRITADDCFDIKDELKARGYRFTPAVNTGGTKIPASWDIEFAEPAAASAEMAWIKSNNYKWSV